ncbi:hypothetical protein BZG36_04706 [Bifiguratus adelaidae]|uniref:D-lactate dehydratase n=1 Tax=Bifiguratus adelaidae TaxID=1938954 RepID=A0A261XWK4_9FUNG|nr:hypothetical protein BZG36_04706 [Bifiguratus adelaidae]
MSKKALVIIADGTEEMEATISIDVLRRAKLNVVVAGFDTSSSKPYVTCSRNVKIVPDVSLDTAVQDAYDVVVIPGGAEGAKTLSSSKTVQSLLQKQATSGIIACICADFDYQEARVVVDGNLITSRGPGTAFLFALTIIKELLGEEAMKEVAGPMIMPSEW